MHCLYLKHHAQFYSLTDWHIVEVECWGSGDMPSGKAFHVKTVRRNPSQVGAVTGSATYASFLSSMLGNNFLLWSHKA